MRIDTGTDTVLAEIVNGVGVVTLNRPERRNALHPDMHTAVPAMLEQFIGDPDVGVIVITGAGTSFCSGGDVRGARKPEAAVESRPPTVEEQGLRLARNARMVELLHASPKITIAALPGAAVGAGMSIALSADLRIAAESARLIPGWGELGFSGDFGGTWFLTRLVGPSKALELLVDNVTVSAADALALGLVNRVVPDGEVHGAAMAWATAIAAGPRTAYELFKENVQQAEHLSLADALPLESERMVRSGMTDDHRQAVKRWLKNAADKRSSQR